MRRSERFVKGGEVTSKRGGKWNMGSEVKWSEVKWSEVKWSEVTIFGEMCAFSLIYSYVAVRMFCAAVRMFCAAVRMFCAAVRMFCAAVRMFCAAVRMFCAVRCLIIICFYLLFSNYSTYVFSIFYVCVHVLHVCFPLCVCSVSLYCFVYCLSFCI